MNIELQVAPQPEFAERIIFGLAKLIVGQIEEGEDWSAIKKVIGIAIMDFNMFSDKRCHHRFGFYDRRAKVYFGDVEEINTIELKKARIERNPRLRAWTLFIGAKSEEELMEAVKMNVQVKKAYSTLSTLSRDPAVRDEYDSRLKFWANVQNEVKGEMQPIIDRKNAEIAQQKNQLAQQKDQLAQQAAEIAALKKMMGLK
jgi:predicted transposase/invertase (TIGR01784 family)